jgi:hypothetical protein
MEQYSRRVWIQKIKSFIEYMKISFLVPSTTNKRDWKCAEQTYLWQILCQSLEDNTPDHQIKIFVGYDSDDPIYSIAQERLKFSAVFTKFKIEWFPMYNLKGELSQIWNKLGEEAIKQDYKYFKIMGDDIQMPNDKVWLGAMINKLKKNNNIGWSAGFSNNNRIATQFLVHKTHYDIFGFFYPVEIKTWGVDDFLHNVYPEKFRNWMKQYHLYNVGGEPRYEVSFNPRFVQAIIRRYRPKLNRHLQKINE